MQAGRRAPPIPLGTLRGIGGGGGPAACSILFLLRNVFGCFHPRRFLTARSLFCVILFYLLHLPHSLPPPRLRNSSPRRQEALNLSLGGYNHKIKVLLERAVKHLTSFGDTLMREAKEEVR